MRIKEFFCAFALMIISIVYADNNAVLPHYQAECVACHEQMVSGNAKVLYERKDRLAKDYEGLKQRVYYCIDQLELNWSEEQTRTVVEYLAKNYYQYPIPQQ